jgi:hypothetical protein
MIEANEESFCKIIIRSESVKEPALPKVSMKESLKINRIGGETVSC